MSRTYRRSVIAAFTAAILAVLSLSFIPSASAADPPVTLTQSATTRVLYQGAHSITLTLPSQPITGRLIVAAVGMDKSKGSAATASAGWTVAKSYTGLSVSQIVAYRVATGTAADKTVTLTWTTNQGAQGIIAETNVTSAVVAQASGFPNPPTDTTVSSITGNAGTATANGLALGFLSVDTADPGNDATWTNGYAALRTEVGDSNTASPTFNGGAALSIASRSLINADSTTTTGAFTGRTDQYTLAVLRLTGTTVAPQPTTANLTLTPGDTTIKADWSLNVGADGANGAILSRDGTSTDQTGTGWTSPNYLATGGSLTFTALYDGQTYNITVQPTLNGVAVGTPTVKQATPAGSPPPTGQFTATSTGGILDPNGAAWRGKGLDVYDWQAVAEGAPLATKMLSSSYFPGTKFVRVAAYSYDTGAQLAPFVNALTQAHVLVVIEHHDPYSSNYTGQTLTDESNWYASLATYFKTNAYVGFGSMNEPGGNDSAQMVSTYNAIRGAGDNNIIFMEAGNGGNGEPNSLTASSFATMHNVGWDIHAYNWESNYSTDVNVITADMNNRISGMAAIPSADGKMPVICEENGNSTNGSTVDPGGSQELQATYNNQNLLAVGAWIWSQGNTTNIDNLTQNEGSLTPMGVQVQGLIAAP